MQHLFECVARAVQERGLRGLLDAVPGGKYAYDVALGAYRFYCERRKLGLFKEELARAAAANAAEVRKVAEEVAQQVAKDAPSEERKALAAYLTQIPNAVRASLKRPEDPFGITVPPTGELPSALSFERVLPQRLPHFREGDELPGRAGWKLHELLGLGGFGEVWLARHALVPTPRAVKFLTDRAARARLAEHEGRVVARVMALGPHPNVVQLLDADASGACPWLMYEHVPDGSLTELVLSWHALPNAERVTRATSALRQLAEAVGAFHRLAPPVVHRDLKPANVLVAADGALKVTDFGIGGAVLPEPTMNTGAPLTGRLETALRGSASPLYASPQQRAGSSPDPRDDVFALGVLAFQMLTGELSAAPGPRFERDLRARGAPADLADLIGDCVDPDAERRPRDAGEVAERIGRGASVVRPTPPAPLPSGRGEKKPSRFA
jgi:serine/threonine protein kinase